MHHRRAGRPRPDPSYRYFDVKVSVPRPRSSFSATSALTIPSSARWCDFASVTGGRCVHPRQGRAEGSNRRVPQGATAQSRTDRPGRTGFDRAARADHPRHRLSQSCEGRHPKAGDSFLSCTVARHWPGLSMNRSIGTSTPSSPPRKPSIWFAGAFRPSRVTARC